MSKLTRRCLSLVLALMLLASMTVGGTLIVSADNKTGDGLAAYAMRAYNEGWRYVWGGASPGAVDCSGLIYSYVGGGARVTEDMLYSSPESGYVSNGVPDIPGIALWQPGHVGVYVGGGMAVDARDEISNVCYQSVATKSWVMWFKVAGVSYGTNDGVVQEDAANESEAHTDSTEETDEKQEDELSIGSTGENVNELQERLKELGYFTDNTTRYFGTVTQGALKEFQKAAGLTASGVLDADTKAAVFADSAPKKAAEEKNDETDEEEAEFTTDDSSIEGSEADSQLDEYTEDESESTDALTEADEADNTAEDASDEQTEEETLFIPEEDSEEAEESGVYDEETDTDEQSSASGSDEEETLADDENTVYEPGDEDAEISEIQYMLIKLGYFDYDITGHYCENTADAVEQFRSDYDLGQARSLSDEALEILYSVYDGSYTVTQTAPQAAMGLLVDAAETGEQEQTDEETTLTAASEETEAALAADETDEQQGEAEVTSEAAVSESNAEPVEQSVTLTLSASDEDKTEASTESDSVSTDNTTTTTTTSSSGEKVVSPKTGNRSVVFIQTEAEDDHSVTYALMAIVISLVIIFFAGTVHYWDVSMEKRKQRARRATTVAVYHRSLL